MRRDKPVIGITMDIDGDYLRLTHHYPEAIAQAGGIPVLLPAAAYPRDAAAVVDGLLIPGGGDIDPWYYGTAAGAHTRPVSRDRTAFEIALLRAIMELMKPVLGICYGMQLLNVAFGGSLYQDIKAEIATPTDHGSGSHEIVGTGDLLKGECVVNTSHHQAVKGLGKDIDIIAASRDGIAEAIRLRDYPFLLGVQWHPERSEDEVSLRLLGSFVEAARGC